MADVDPMTARWAAALEEELAWLLEDGYERVRVMAYGAHNSIAYAGEHGRVTSSIDPRDGALIWLAPPDPVDARAPIDALRGPRVLMDSVLKMRGLDAPSGKWGEPDTAEDVILRYARRLRELRPYELSGDWSRYDEARQVGLQMRRAAVEQVRDPAMRAIMRGYRRPPKND